MLRHPLNQLMQHSSQQLRKNLFFQDSYDSDQFMAQHLKTQKTQDQRLLYEQPFKKQEGREQSADIKQRISLAITLVEQNDQLAKMISLVSQQLDEQMLKSTILQEQITKNNMEVTLLNAKLKQVKEENKLSRKLDHLNQSSIPNKSAEMSTTYNTNSWVNQFLNKEDLQNLWTQRRTTKVKLIDKKEDKTVKKYTLDLNAAVVSDRMKKGNKISSSCNIREESSQREAKKTQRSQIRPKKTITSVVYKSRQASKRYDLKLDLNQKQKKMSQLWQKTKSRPLSYIRNARKVKNPEI